jgi:subtilase family serine protease
VGLRWSDDDADASDPSHLCLSLVRGLRLEVTYAAPAVADLKVTGLDVRDKDGATGCSSDGLNTLTVVIRNDGDAAPAKPVDVSISYGLQTDHVQTMPGAITAGPGGEQRVDFTGLHLGADSTMVEVTIDAARAVTLRSHADPSFSGTITCANRGADLSIKKAELNKVDLGSPDANGACKAGATNGVMITISNLGDADPGVFNAGILIDGKLVKQASVGGVGPKYDKGSYVGDFAIPAGTHTIQAIVDPDKKVAEANEGNNTTPAVTITCPRA